VYDLDGDGYIGRQDLTTMFQASSMLKISHPPSSTPITTTTDEDDTDGLSDAVIAMFVSKVFETFGCSASGLISFECVLRYMKSNQSTCDVWDLFGRSMLKESTYNNNKHKQHQPTQQPHNRPV
jgi:Ca2+-binding EF-hand superfamily protein